MNIIHETKPGIDHEEYNNEPNFKTINNVL